MKQQIKIFSVLMLALTTMPCFAVDEIDFAAASAAYMQETQSSILRHDTNSEPEEKNTNEESGKPASTSEHSESEPPAKSGRDKSSVLSKSRTSEKQKKQQDINTKKTNCSNKNGRWDGVTCWCGAKVQSLDENAAQCPTKEEKDQQKDAKKTERNNEKEKKKSDCETKNGRWDGVTCWCGAKVQSLDENADKCPTADEKAEKKKDNNIANTAEKIKEKAQKIKIGDSISYDTDINNADSIREAVEEWNTACDNESKKYQGAKGAKKSVKGITEKTITRTCLLECDADKGFTPSKDEKTCIHTSYKDKESCVDTVSDKYAKTATWNDATKTCNIETCQDGYTPKDNKCITDKKAQKQEDKEKKKLDEQAEKQFIADVDKLTTAFDSVVDKYKKECDLKKGKIENGECKTVD